MRSEDTPPRIEQGAEVSYRLEEAQPWAFETDHAADIDAHWQKCLAGNPHLFNGRVLLMRGSEMLGAGSSRRLQGTCFSVPFKSFMAWRDFDFPGQGVVNVFGMAALRSTEGIFLLGEMAGTTANPGRIYFPAGTPDMHDLKDGNIDFEGSVTRELKEETGLNIDSARVEPGWTVVSHGAYIACMKALRSSLPAAEIIARVDAFLAREQHPELAGLRPVASPDDFDHDRMPEFALAYMRHVWAQEKR